MAESEPCYYSVLGLRKQASVTEIRDAYRKLALVNIEMASRPVDKNPAVAGQAKRRFQQIQEAYSVLSNKGKKRLYDPGMLGFLGDDDDEGFCDFMQEMLLMMENVRSQPRENEGVQKKKNPKLSKSQERKLKKLEQEKEKAFLLAKSIETLEKYKIPEDAFSLLRSSRNISRVETVREKRRMAVQFSKAGLEVSHGDQPFKMCTDGASCKIEVESKSINWLSMNKNDHLQPMVRETEVDASDSLAISQELVSYCKQLNSNSGSVSGFSSEEVPSEEDSIGFSPTSCCHDTRKTSHLMFLYEAGFGSKQSVARGGIIGVTQPRRVAVLATARRVAYELGLHLGKEVGFQVRHDKRIGDSCTIKFMTDGILLREAQNDFLLKRYSVIILDEAHERSVNTDILIGMLCRAIPLRQKIYEDQQQMLLSGQSINPENMTISSNCAFLKENRNCGLYWPGLQKVLSIHKRLPQGGILVFVTGQREVEFLCQKLRKASKKLIANTAEGNIRNEASATPEMSSIEEINMKDINEAFEIQGNSTNEQTDRFSSYEKELPYPNEDESDVSYNSETESEIEIVGDDGDSGDQSISENDGNLLGVLGEGSLTALRAAFEVLAGKNASDPNSEGKHNPSMPEDLLEQSNHIVAKKNGGDKSVSVGALCVLPLYAMLPAAAQLRVFEGVKEEERLVVVATNVAETSLTIPGIKYVVDTGREKVKNYNPSNGMETYEIQWISKASAAQRAGRAGRTGPGHCYRLYSSAVFNNIFPDFSCAEISKVPVDSIVLVLKSMSINKVANFPFPTPPEATALVEAEKCLKTLEALDDSGRLTPLGKAMAHFPMSPRHSRMLLTVIQIMRKVKNYARANLVLGYAVAAAAALSLTNPFLMEFVGSHDNSNGLEQDGISDSLGNEINLDKQEKLRRKKLKEMAKLSRAKFSNPTSDAMTIAYALQCFELSNNPVEFCTENALHLKTMEEMSKLRKQLLQLVFNQNVNHGFDQEFSWIHGTVGDVEQAWRVSFSKNPLLLNEEELLGQAICAGWADRVAKRIRGDSKSSEGDRKVNSVRYEACGVKEIVFLHRWSSLSNSAPEFLVYSELLRRNGHTFMEQQV
ncbi:hypothetical protein GH714_037713 [Hevea brasiliensis]|uniref:RNA helicase n=1 Tax=Hevea brasiliensis TaxID=3981 RepID=A0A6A6LX27_HEVBR|nr:hypothetical protein GH714_037713 [Hevea brasiliensis]